MDTTLFTWLAPGAILLLILALLPSVFWPILVNHKKEPKKQ